MPVVYIMTIAETASTTAIMIIYSNEPCAFMLKKTHAAYKYVD
jgi:hypothetical protein